MSRSPPESGERSDQGRERDGRVARGARWILAAHGVGQGVRFVAHLGVARLVAPEAFGQMLLVALVLEGAALLSDVGLKPSIARSERGEDPAFLDTAWTLGVLRGGLLGGGVLLLAPALGALFERPDIVPLLRAGALAPVLQGLESTRGDVLTRKLDFRRQVVVGLGSYLAGVGVMGAWAWISPSAWALLGGQLGHLGLKLVLSFTVLPGHAPRLRLEPAARRELFDFGKWILPSTALGLVAAQGDRFFLGLHLGAAALGVFAVAQRLTQTGLQVFLRLTQSILLPALGEAWRARPEALRLEARRLRRWLDLAFLGGCGLLAGGGPIVVALLYDARYQEAGWMLQILAARTALVMLAEASQTALFARGEAQAAFRRSLARAVALIVLLPAGHLLLGVPGLLGGLVLSELPSLLVLLVAERAAGLFDPRVLLRAGLALAAGAAVGGALQV
jgi:O-antigen/teichoic acid export membrane protein